MPDPCKTLHPTQRRFLRCFEACASVTKAARWAKIHRQNHYDWMDEVPDYKRAFAEVEKRALRTLEDEAIRRAHEGVREPVFYKGRIVGYLQKYSDSLMQTALKAWGPEKYRERSTVALTDKDGNNIFPQAALEEWIKAGPNTDDQV